MPVEGTAKYRLLPEWARALGLSGFFIHRGPSMEPTIRAGQRLYVRPAVRDIRPGDVVAYAEKGGTGIVVHRLVSIGSQGLTTRGDNNLHFDSPVPAEHVLGRVEFLESNGRIKPVRGGCRGLWAARYGWATRRFASWVCMALRPFYRGLRGSRLVRRALVRLCRSDLLTVELVTPKGTVVKTSFKGHTVACWWPAEERFWCKRPFDLVLVAGRDMLGERFGAAYSASVPPSGGEQRL